MRIRWTVPAADDLEGLKTYLQEHFPHYAESTVRTIYHRIKSLKADPHKGRPGHRSGTRELPIIPLPYVVVLFGEVGNRRDFAHLSRRAGLARLTAQLFLSVA